MLDTGSSRTLIRADLVNTEKLVEGEISIRCAHGDIITYPLAKVEIEIGGEHFIVEAGVVDKLPVSVLLGWDVPRLEDLLQDGSTQKEALQTEDTMAVITRAQKERNKEEAAALAYKEHMSGAVSHPVQEDPSKNKEDEVPEFQFAEELFTEGRTKTRLSGSQKREHNLQLIQEQTPKHPLEMTAGELSQLQEVDSSLDAVRRAVKGEASTAGSGFFRRDGLIYRKWTPPGQDQEEWALGCWYSQHPAGKLSCSQPTQSLWLDVLGGRRLLNVYCSDFTGQIYSRMQMSFVKPATSAKKQPQGRRLLHH